MDITQIPEMSLDLLVNEVRLFIDLTSSVDLNKSLDILRSLGFQPFLKKYFWEKEGVLISEICALIYQGIPEDPESEFNRLNQHWDNLSSFFGSESVNLVWGTQE